MVLGGFPDVVPGMHVGDFDDSGLDAAMSTAARRFLAQTVPPPLNAAEVDMEWAGILGFSDDGLPYVSPLLDAQTGRESMTQFIAAGFTGSGMPQAFLAGNAVAELVVGRDPATFVEAFRPSNRPLGPLAAWRRCSKGRMTDD